MTKLRNSTILAILTLSIIVIMTSPAVNADTPTNWVRTDNDNFYFTTEIPKLFEFESNLYAYYDNNIYKFTSVNCFEWNKLNTPVQGVAYPIGNVIYVSSDDQLWYIKEFQSFTNDWKNVVSLGLPVGSRINPMTLYNGQLYAAVYQSGVETFDIYRTPDFGKTQMIWSKVVSNGFGDIQNHALGTMIEYNNKLIAVTDITRSGVFGDHSKFGQGIEVWESPTGDENSWYQINKDGFGTEITNLDSETFRTNQDFGSAAIYDGLLYIGTLAHYGGQVWRYNGNGLNGWEDVTPHTIGPGYAPGRAAAMKVFQNYLYLGEGYPTGNLQTYDGTNWNIVVPGSNPFDPANIGIYSLETVNDKLYSAMRGSPTTGLDASSQVWGFPFTHKLATCSVLTGATISVSPNTATNELGTSSIQIHSVKAKVESNGVGVLGSEVTFNIISGPNAGNVGSGITDNNGEAPFNYSAKQGQVGIGTDIIEACFTDVNGGNVCSQATKKWVDTTPPVIKCLETSVNKKKTGPYELIAKDAVDPNPKIFVVDTGSGEEFGPFTSGTIIQYTVNQGKPKQKKNGKNIDIKGNGDLVIKSGDASGNVVKASCT